VSRITDFIEIEYITRSHCIYPTCQKCVSRVRWLRRKAWRSNKSSTRKNNYGRK
jgi:hypothetical protein